MPKIARFSCIRWKIFILILDGKEISESDKDGLDLSWLLNYISVGWILYVIFTRSGLNPQVIRPTQWPVDSSFYYIKLSKYSRLLFFRINFREATVAWAYTRGVAVALPAPPPNPDLLKIFDTFKAYPESRFLIRSKNGSDREFSKNQ